MVELLTKHGAEVNAKDKYGQTPLHFAAMTGNIGAASVLVVDCGASVEVSQDHMPELPMPLHRLWNRSNVCIADLSKRNQVHFEAVNDFFLQFVKFESVYGLVR